MTIPTQASRLSLCGLALLLALLASAPALAGGSPSESSCDDLGKINIECSVCDTGEYLGMVTVDAAYAPDFESCNGDYRAAWQRCAAAYGRDKSDIGMKWEYWLGGTKYSNHWPKKCIY